MLSKHNLDRLGLKPKLSSLFLLLLLFCFKLGLAWLYGLSQTQRPSPARYQKHTCSVRRGFDFASGGRKNRDSPYCCSKAEDLETGLPFQAAAFPFVLLLRSFLCLFWVPFFFVSVFSLSLFSLGLSSGFVPLLLCPFLLSVLLCLLQAFLAQC